MTETRRWAELRTTDFSDIDRETVVVLPLAAIEQHGPHLPLDVDLRICEGLLAEAERRVGDGPPFLAMPTQAIGYSAEHGAFPGTLSLPPELALKKWTALAGQVAALGFRRIVLFNSHGGNADLMRVAVRELRVAHGVLAVAASWYRLADFGDLVAGDELAHGIHGGALETSVMLHLRPEAVDMSRAGGFTSSAVALAAENRHLSATGAVQFGWASQDLHPSGAVGDANAATAAIGAAVVDRAVEGFLELLREVAAFDLATLRDGSAT